MQQIIVYVDFRGLLDLTDLQRSSDADGSRIREVRAVAVSLKTLRKTYPIMARVELDTPAPEFTLPDLHGNSVSLSDFTGRENVLVVFNRGFI